MRQVKIYNQTRALPGELQAGYCDRFGCRLRGLSLRRTLPQSQGLLLVQQRANRLDAAIHMFFMNFDLTIVWLDATKQVVDIRLARRWRSVIMPQAAARYVLELPTFWFDYFSVGDQIEFENTLSD